MKPETQLKLVSLIERNVAAGFVRGQQLFAESLETDLEKQEILEQVQLDGVLDYLYQDYIQRHSR
jgi:hypothetical protein